MADRKKPAVSFDDIIQEARKRRQDEQLAQEIFGKNKSRFGKDVPTGPKPGFGGSLASRVGVTKARNSSIPRTNTPRGSHQTPARSGRPQANDSHRSEPARFQATDPIIFDGQNSAHVGDEEINGGDGLNIRGAARGPHTVVAQNFAPGTTAADIESVMLSVGGEMTSCRLVTSTPTVIAEMDFVDKAGAEKVIDTFNGKKADGRILYVFGKTGAGSVAQKRNNQNDRYPPQTEPEAPVISVREDVTMEIDENLKSREAENRLREERRRVDDRVQRDVFPTGPKSDRMYDDRFYRGARRPEAEYQPNRYPSPGGGDRYGGRGYFRDDSRRYGGGQGWRP